MKDKKYLREEYVLRINRVIDFIEREIDADLNLEQLARVANFSPYHFHRIFRSIVGEPLNRFIQRLRLEKAAAQLVNNPRKSITEIALDCGFSGSAAFARAFSEYFGMSARQWRSEKSRIDKEESKIRKSPGKDCKDRAPGFPYIDHKIKTGRKSMKKTGSLKVSVTTMPDMPVAYIRHIGPYKGDGELFDRLYNKLFTWAGARDLLKFPGTRVFAVYHDNPEVTSEDRLRTSLCISVPDEVKAQGEIGRMTLPGGKYAVAQFELAVDEFEEAWESLFSEWLPESGYQPDDRPAFEECLNDPAEHPQGKHIVKICIPVKPL